jgi:ribosome-binding factor A
MNRGALEAIIGGPALFPPTDRRYPESVDPHRHERVSQSIREELDELIGYELTDPRVGTANVTEVHISPDYRHAHVRLALHGDAAEQQTTLEVLERAKTFLRRELAERLQLFKTPELHFDADMPAQIGAKAPQLLKRIRRGRPKT